VEEVDLQGVAAQKGQKGPPASLGQAVGQGQEEESHGRGVEPVGQLVVHGVDGPLLQGLEGQGQVKAKPQQGQAQGQGPEAEEAGKKLQAAR